MEQKRYSNLLTLELSTVGRLGVSDGKWLSQFHVRSYRAMLQFEFEAFRDELKGPSLVEEFERAASDIPRVVAEEAKKCSDKMVAAARQAFKASKGGLMDEDPGIIARLDLDVQCLDREIEGIGHVVHIKIRRSNGKDGLTWDELQEVKSDAGYGDRAAIEVYPRQDEIVNYANIRHLWVLPDGFPCPNIHR